MNTLKAHVLFATVFLVSSLSMGQAPQASCLDSPGRDVCELQRTGSYWSLYRNGIITTESFTSLEKAISTVADYRMHGVCCRIFEPIKNCSLRPVGGYWGIFKNDDLFAEVSFDQKTWGEHMITRLIRAGECR